MAVLLSYGIDDFLVDVVALYVLKVCATASPVNGAQSKHVEFSEVDTIQPGGTANGECTGILVGTGDFNAIYTQVAGRLIVGQIAVQWSYNQAGNLIERLFTGGILTFVAGQQRE